MRIMKRKKRTRTRKGSIYDHIQFVGYDIHGGSTIPSEEKYIVSWGIQDGPR